MRDIPAGPHPHGDTPADVERPMGRPRQRHTGEPGTPGRRLKRARMAMALVMVAQLVVGFVTPFVHARAQSSIGAHFEMQGARRHYIHDEGRCAVCAARHVLAVPAPLPPSLPPSSSRVAVARPAAEAARPRARHTPSAPRAPPAAPRIV